MFPYVELLKWDNGSLVPFQLVHPSECWFEISYYDFGEFEVYTAANLINLEALKKGNFVKIPNKPYLWIITSVQYEYNAEGARMIDVKGFEAKYIISYRIIRDPLELPTSLKDAITLLFDLNIGFKAISQRQIPGLTYSFDELEGKQTEAQATRSNLWEFTSNLLKLHKCGLISTYQNGKLNIEAVNGVDRSESILFAQSLDNLISATYYTSDEELRTHCQIVSTFNEQTAARLSISNEIVAYEPEEAEGTTGIKRKEMILQSNLSTKVTQPDGTEIEIDPESSEYNKMQKAEGASALAEKITVTEFNGEIDLEHSRYEFEKDFFVGDLVKVKDEYFGYSAIARINKYTFSLDNTGAYHEEAEYGNE